MAHVTYTLRYRDNGSVVIVSSDGRESEPVGYQGIAKLDHNICATSDYYRGVLPALFIASTLQEHPEYIPG